MLALLLTMAATETVVPTPVEAGRALATQQSCFDADGFTDCGSNQPTGATFRRITCTATGRSGDDEPTATCVYDGARLTTPNGQRLRHGSGSIQVVGRTDDNGRVYWAPISR